MDSILQRPLRVHLVALAAYTVLAVLMTLPIALRLGDTLLGTDSNAINDTYFSVWIFGWQAQQLIADPLNLFQGNIFFPFQNTLAYSEIILPAALLYLPIEYATANPVLAYNLVLLITFPLNALAMYLYALDWFPTAGVGTPRSDDPTRPRNALYAGAFLAGLIFAFCTYKMGELRHIQLLMALFMPLTLMYVARFMRTPTFHNAFLTALFFALNALSSLYYAVFLAFAVALYVGLDLLWQRFKLTRAHFIYGAVAVLIAAFLVLPFLLPFFRLESENDFSAGRDAHLFSARPASYLAAPASQWLYGNLTRAFYVASKGQPLFPGIAVLVLSTIGLIALIIRKQRAWVFVLLLALMGFLLSFGPDLLLGRETELVLPFSMPYGYLARILTPLKSLNAPARFVVLTMIALALLSAYALNLLMRRKPRWGTLIALVCGALVLLEYSPVPLRMVPVEAGATISPVYTFLAQQPRGQAVVELPMGEPTFADQDRYVVYTYNSLYHRQPLVNGYSTFIPPEYYALVRDVQEFPKKIAVRRLQEWGAQWLVVHSDRYENREQMRRLLNRRPELEHVQDFGDIWLYRVLAR